MTLIRRPPVELAPGAVHVPGWLDMETQRRLVTACRVWASPPAGMRHTRMRNGARMSVQTVCLGWHWCPYRYSCTLDDEGGEPVKPFPDLLGDIGRHAHREVFGDAHYNPDIALINFYDEHARMGQHQDKDELSPAAVVSLSIGDAAVFRFGNTENRGRPYRDVRLESGDLVVFGGPSRLAYHGVPRVFPGTADTSTGLTGGRINITLRESGF